MEDFVQIGEVQRSKAAGTLRWLLVVGLLAANLAIFEMGSLAAVFGGGLRIHDVSSTYEPS
jgi:hypothetical protein